MSLEKRHIPRHVRFLRQRWHIMRPFSSGRESSIGSGGDEDSSSNELIAGSVATALDGVAVNEACVISSFP